MDIIHADIINICTFLNTWALHTRIIGYLLLSPLRKTIIYMIIPYNAYMTYVPDMANRLTFYKCKANRTERPFSLISSVK